MRAGFREDVSRIDRLCTEKFGISVETLMESAGEALLSCIRENIPDYTDKKFLILCGTGNNGGDGAVLARKLKEERVDVKILFRGDPAEAKGEAALNIQKTFRLSIPFSILHTGGEFLPEHRKLIHEADAVVDAVYGSGFHGELQSPVAELFKYLNQSRKIVVSADMPSGVSAEGPAAENAVQATFTAVFGIDKPGIIDFPGREMAGVKKIYPIGIPEELLESAPIRVLDRNDIKTLLQKRPRNSHKGSWGKLLVLGGSKGGSAEEPFTMAGAVVLACKAAYRSGAGLVAAAVPEACRLPVQVSIPEAVMVSLPDNLNQADKILKNILGHSGFNTVLAGNGMGTGNWTERVLEILLEENKVKNMAFDADALNLFSKNLYLKKLLGTTGGDILLTPHIAEAARLLGWNVESVKKDKRKAAAQIAEIYSASVILKDAVSVLAFPSGEVEYSGFGSSVLAKAGSGDVLAGTAAGLIASGYLVPDAARLSCYLLGRAGELYESRYDSRTALASELPDFYADVFRELEG